MRSTPLLLSALLLGLLLPLPLGLRRADAGPVTARADVMPVSQVKRGMKGHGLTVFEGTKPERFDVEVIDVLKNFRPRQDLILVKTKHPRLDVAKVVAGMSGSPIYIGNKMIGAYAYGWTFGVEPVAGVTPIENMIEELTRPLPDRIDGWPIKVLPGAAKVAASKPEAGREVHGLGDRRSLYRGELVKYDLFEHGRQLGGARSKLGPAPADNPIAPVTTPLLMGGMTPGAISAARELMAPLGLEPMQAGGSGATEPDAPRRFEDGGAVGVQLIRGDMSAMGLGTVTRVEGDRLVAFGHPMMEAGFTALPTAIGRVLWFLASDMRSFKIGMPVRDVGALVSDRQSAIVVSHSATAPIIPVKMSIKGISGLPSATWNFEVAHEKFMTASFMAIALGSALQAVANERQDVSWNAKSVLKVKGYGSITLEDYGISVGGTPEAGEFARSNLIRAVGALMNNPWQPVIVESASMEIELRYAREVLRLRGAELLEPEIDAGDPARIRLTLVPYSGPEQTRVVSVPLPAYLAGQTVNFEILPGYMEERDAASPDTLAELIKNLENPVYPPQSAVITFSGGGTGVSFKGRVAKNLPPGAMDVIRPTTSSLAPEAFASTIRHVVPLTQFMVGRDRTSVTVRPVLR